MPRAGIARGSGLGRDESGVDKVVIEHLKTTGVLTLDPKEMQQKKLTMKPQLQIVALLQPPFSQSDPLIRQHTARPIGQEDRIDTNEGGEGDTNSSQARQSNALGERNRKRKESRGADKLAAGSSLCRCP